MLSFFRWPSAGLQFEFAKRTILGLWFDALGSCDSWRNSAFVMVKWFWFLLDMQSSSERISLIFNLYIYIYWYDWNPPLDNLLSFFCVGLFQQIPFAILNLSGSKVELVLDLSFTAGHQGDTLASAWAVTDGKGEPIGPRIVLEVVHLGLHKNWENLEMFLLAVCCQHVIFQSELYIPAGKFPIRSRVLSVNRSSCCRHIEINGGSYQNSQKWMPLRWI